MTYSGRIIEEQKNYYIADTPFGPVAVTVSGTLRKNRTKICTGDVIDFQLIDDDPPRGVITALHDRTTFIRRPALANCSHLLCVCTIKEPPINLEMLDRLIFSALYYRLEPHIIINKSDLLDPHEETEAIKLLSAYRTAGIPGEIVSAQCAHGIDAIINTCNNRITAFAGLSGVGKSSLLSCIFPHKNLRIGSLSAAATRGTHTTTNTTLLSLPGGGYIADTPGIAFVTIPAVPADDVIHYFREIAECIGGCRFNDCRHKNEPGCLVREKVVNGKIAPWRHRHYLRFYDEMRAIEKEYR